MFYRKITEEFCESLRLLYQQWDLELKEFKRKKEKLNVGITISLI